MPRSAMPGRGGSTSPIVPAPGGGRRRRRAPPRPAAGGGLRRGRVAAGLNRAPPWLDLGAPLAGAGTSRTLSVSSSQISSWVTASPTFLNQVETVASYALAASAPDLDRAGGRLGVAGRLAGGALGGRAGFGGLVRRRRFASGPRRWSRAARRPRRSRPPRPRSRRARPRRSPAPRRSPCRSRARHSGSSTFDRVAGLLQPGGDRGLGDRLAERRHADLDAHVSQRSFRRPSAPRRQRSTSCLLALVLAREPGRRRGRRPPPGIDRPLLDAAAPPSRFSIRVDEEPGAHVARLLLAPDELRALLVAPSSLVSASAGKG